MKGLPICLLIKHHDFEILTRGIILNYDLLKIDLMPKLDFYHDIFKLSYFN